MTLQLVTRDSCHLCEEALRLLRQAGFEPEELDVDQDQALFDLYDFRVPVIIRDGRLALEGRITAETIRTALGLGGSPLSDGSSKSGSPARAG